MAGRFPPGSDIEAALQEAFVRAWLRPAGEIQSMDGWIRVVASNLVRSDLRRREAETRALGRLAQTSYEDVPSEPLLAQAAVDDALAGLSERQRRPFVLHYLEDCSVEQVADALGVSPGTVKQHPHAGCSP